MQCWLLKYICLWSSLQLQSYEILHDAGRTANELIHYPQRRWHMKKRRYPEIDVQVPQSESVRGDTQGGPKSNQPHFQIWLNRYSRTYELDFASKFCLLDLRTHQLDFVQGGSISQQTRFQIGSLFVCAIIDVFQRDSTPTWCCFFFSYLLNRYSQNSTTQLCTRRNHSNRTCSPSFA